MERIRTIKSQKQYRSSLKRIDSLIESKPNTSDFELLELLSILVDDYENKHYPVEP